MKWYVAHVVMAVVTRSDHVGPTEAYENMYLVVAESDQAARERAKELGQQQEQHKDTTFKWKGTPASFRFLGVRKLVTISNPNHIQSQDEIAPCEGTELSYSLLDFDDLSDAERFARGETVRLMVVE